MGKITQNKVEMTEHGYFMTLKVNGVVSRRKCEILDDVITPIVYEKEILLDAIGTGFEIVNRDWK